MEIVILLFIILLLLSLSQPFTEAQLVGVCYGRIADNLPMEKDVIDLYKSNGIGLMRLYDPDLMALKALQGSNIKLMLGVPNEKIQPFASSNQSHAMQWIETYVAPFAPSIKYIVVGNEIHPSDNQSVFVEPAMKNVLEALNSYKLSNQIKVSTSIDTTLIINSYPPSNGQFNDTSYSYITPIIKFLTNNESPLLVNIYPYFAYVGNEQSISLNYALFTSNGPVVDDKELKYQNLFDAMVDSVYWSLRKVGAPDMKIVVSETGWPSKGGDAATVENAENYYRNLLKHVKNGTPYKPQEIETYLFAMFDENKKLGPDSERNFGLFTPQKYPKYGKLNFI
ncbi:glucan endo-1,3-beta-glucosidase-like [Amaranthus tricolor]|uniref:glucan endo-1,3-beta-glucosidase-like n=1 Tax=Amaranthus tricolor TaxID=29722 RepID=UPI0025882EDD|nr:glucan endo-1,3-beta-glucosidase-like [Amaranthus tricolor]